MAFLRTGLRRIAFGGAASASEAPKKIYSYVTNDAWAVVAGGGYFNTAITELAIGDVIQIQGDIDGTPYLKTVVITSVTTNVAFSSEGAIGLTDNSGGTAGGTLSANAAKQKLVIPVPLLADLVNAAVWKIKVPFAHTLLSATFRTGKPATTAAKAATLTATVGGVAVTGGVIGLTSANQNATGNNTDASAISGAGATGLPDGTIEWTVSGVTAFVEGGGYLEMSLLNVDLANALASLNAQG
jgi:hypothetical protein